MLLKDAQKRADEQIMNYGGYWSPLSMMLRLIEEIGELARAVNIKYGDKKSKSPSDGRDIENELVDVFYATIALANIYNFDLGETEIEQIQLGHRRRQNNNIDYLSLPLKLNNRVGVLSGLMSRAFSNNTYMDQSKVKILIQNIINDTIKVATLFEVDLAASFANKVSADENKLNKVYNQ